MHPVETYLKALCEIHSTGGATAETSYYAALEALLNEVGAKLKPKVRAVAQLANTGAGSPDFGLFTASQFQRAKDDRPIEGAPPERGVVEVKGWADDSFVTAETPQVSKYWKRYGLVLVTNYRDFVLIGNSTGVSPVNHGRDGHATSCAQPVRLETYRMADSEKDFRALLAHPRKAADAQGERLLEFLRRVLLYEAALADPEDLAWFLASYAREARARVKAAADLPALGGLRKALEEALGMTFEGEKGEHFFQATLVQTLFYGVFSSWVLWSRERGGMAFQAMNHGQDARATSGARFDWHNAAWTLHVPMVASLFNQIATPQKLKPLGVDEVLDWAGAALNRVDRAAFFAKFEEEHAVQYFYEPFLQAYDPELRKELGVWYTPPEIVQYQVERVDRVLREELDLPNGLNADKYKTGKLTPWGESDPSVFSTESNREGIQVGTAIALLVRKPQRTVGHKESVGLESVGPAPSPVILQDKTAEGGCPTQEKTQARQAPADFRRHLPHFEGRGNPLFITFTTKNRWHLPEAARALVLKHILHDHPAKMKLICAVVMPDHAHMLYYPMCDAKGNRYTKTEIVGAIKSASAHSINKLLKRKGPVWKDESFDHVTRKSESIEAKAQYIVENPVRKGLCREVNEYPYLWRAWVDDVGQPPSAVMQRGVGQPPSAVMDEMTSEMTGEGGSPTLAQLDPDAGELEVTAGWGHAGARGVCMPGRGKAEEREAKDEDKSSMAFQAMNRGQDARAPTESPTTLDIYLNEHAYWENVPRAVWDYTIGGYQVIKKWLSYREKAMLGRGLTMEEAEYVTEMVRRIAALILLQGELDKNYEAVKADTWPWPQDGTRA